MKDWTFRQWNRITGWVVFIIALVTYLLTMERKFSFWDTGEYISSAAKLEVTHAPGAALFQLVGAVFCTLAFGHGEYYALIINAMSGLFSAFTILFLFWTITHMMVRLNGWDFQHLTKTQEKITLFAGAVGALCFTFSDTFWYSAVEGEVYSMASLFIALLVWLMTKWDEEAHLPSAHRWLILIFFVVGLGVGVHMMCLLAIPAFCLLYYARKYEFSWKSFIIANAITLGVLIFVFKFIFPFIMGLFGKAEIFAVNGMGLPFHSGTVITFLLLIGLSALIIRLSFTKTNKAMVRTASLSLVFMLIGFSCWMVIPIRANANPPMNLNNPDNALGMLDYYNREQYGDWPLFKGQNYTAYLDNAGMMKNEDGSLQTKTRGYIYEKDEKTNTYRKVGEHINYVYNPNQVTFFPRMFQGMGSEGKEVMSNYMLYGAPEFEFNYDNEEVASSPEAKKVFDQLKAKYNDGTITIDDYLQAKEYDLLKVKPPTFGQNLDYFINFQNNHYFLRYLLWNYVGRQNDLDGQMETTRGNWISGIPFIDQLNVGDMKDMPTEYKNESTVYFFFLPLILGLIGLYFQAVQDFKRFYALLALFILTSVGIVFYTGMKPFEPRERDYAMVGSFYAYAIWIGLGAGVILEALQKKLKNPSLVPGAGVVLMMIPAMMAFQNYQSHDRSGRSAAYDYAYSSLKNINKDGILFVYGDNDTYPLWALQETERFRDDVKVVNFTLVGTAWNIDQVKRRTYNSAPIPSQLVHEDYREDRNEQIVLLSSEDWKGIFENMASQQVNPNTLSEFQKYLTQDSMTVKEAVSFIQRNSEQKDIIKKMLFGEEKYEKFNFLPVNKFVLPVNKKNVLASGAVRPQEAGLMVDYIPITYKSRTMYKANLVLMDILANNDWKRTLNFSTGGVYDPENVFFMQDYLQYDGMSYRLIPIQTKRSETGDLGRVDPQTLYQNVKNFRWGGFSNTYNHFDDAALSNIYIYRMAASRAAESLALSGQQAKAREMIALVNKEIPLVKYTDPRGVSSIINAMILSGQEKEGMALAKKSLSKILKDYAYFMQLDPSAKRFAGRDMKMKPLEYSMVVSAVTDALKTLNKPKEAYMFAVESMRPIDKKFEGFVNHLKAIGKEKAFKESENVTEITAFYQYMFDVMDGFDSTYSKEKEHQITSAIIKYAQ